VGQWLYEGGVRLRTIWAAQGEAVPPCVPEGIHGIVALGGYMGVNDDHVAPSLPTERTLLARAARGGLPVMGLCLGAQLLAVGMGGRVELGPCCEVGLSYVEKTPEAKGERVFGVLPEGPVPATQWHQDHVTELPQGAVLLLSNQACKIQAFRVGARAYGMQFHAEVRDTGPRCTPVLCSTLLGAEWRREAQRRWMPRRLLIHYPGVKAK
jgi:GMP synthase (glutamine-hydrolysing)